MRTRLAVSVGAMMMAAAVLGAPAPARACGGTFCDSAPVGQPPMPVDQTGENVLFVMKQGKVEAHIQIQYTGDPETFAWIIPVQKVPTVSVGSQLLFVNLLNATVPTFQLTTTFTSCSGPNSGSSSSSGAGCGASSSDSGGGSFSAGSGGAPTKNEDAPQVLSRDAVGNFEVVTLQPVSAQGLLDWLVDNGFEPDSADAEPVIQDYLSRNFVFVAVKLKPNAGIDEIHPLVIEYDGDEPCVPLKLTRIAAVEDMTVRTFFLGENRVVPSGSYKHVKLDSARLDWNGLGANYNLALARAVDTPVANGRAFITEYAGPSSGVSKTGIYSSAWSSAAFESLVPSEVVPELESQGLVSCATASSCVASHPLVFPLLGKHLPAPAGVTEAAFYSCVECYPEADLSAWDPLAFAADFDELVVQPGLRAQAALGSVYLTRMVTRISPAEMTEDPIFVEWQEPLPDVTNVLSATQTNRCDGSLVTTAPDGRQIVGSTATLPTDLPWAEIVEEYQASGEHIVLVDNDSEIDTQLAAYNGPTPVTPNPDAATAMETSGACACNLAGRNQNPGIAFALLGALGLLRRAFRRER